VNAAVVYESSFANAAREQGALEEPGIGAREWLDRMPPATGLAAAAFDTRAGKPRLLTGSAAHGIANRLRRHGCTLVCSPEGFIVEGTSGPLAAGEAERAATWARSLPR
jgi:hypothetical protein